MCYTLTLTFTRLISANMSTQPDPPAIKFVVFVKAKFHYAIQLANQFASWFASWIA